jgi:MerR family mercuric resistance operon transcriptional regulator
VAQTVHIGKAAELAGVSVDTVRFYQRLGIVQVPDRSAGGYRLFDEGQIHNLKFVRHAQDLGFSLSEIKDLLALRETPHACAKVQSMLKSKVADVRSKIRDLVRLEADLAKALRTCNRELRLKRGIKHDDRCPLLTTLEREDGTNGTTYASRRRKTGKD